ncbi:hypothetical protein ABT112_19160 [Streptomyces sp. NPDC002055]|uniref:hypothetical protein n=1 Tax=Streptomyces sp. NPDC002055 TaxID=3154534 RepID=UPI0033233FB0
MKQGTAKTLGAAVLGAAFAVAAAGTAAADGVQTQLPVENAVKDVPGGQQAVRASEGALDQSMNQTLSRLPLDGNLARKQQNTRDVQGVQGKKKAGKGSQTGLLGGLPVGNINSSGSGAGLPIG